MERGFDEDDTPAGLSVSDSSLCPEWGQYGSLSALGRVTKLCTAFSGVIDVRLRILTPAPGIGNNCSWMLAAGSLFDSDGLV